MYAHWGYETYRTRVSLYSLALGTVMHITAGSTDEILYSSNKLTLSTPNSQNEGQHTSSFTSSVSNILGSNYDITPEFRADGRYVKAFSEAIGRSIIYGNGDYISGVIESVRHGGLNTKSPEGIVIATALGSSPGLIAGVKTAYYDFKKDPIPCRTS